MVNTTQPQAAPPHVTWPYFFPPAKNGTRWSIWIELGIILILLVLITPLLFFPLGPDNALFYVAGQKIVYQGAIHYRDIVDVKPPLIYYLNALSIVLFGDHERSMRVLDLILQFATVLFVLRLVGRATGNRIWALLSAVLYIFMYCSTGYMNTSQPESFLGLVMVPATILFLYYRTPRSFAVIGLLCGIAALLKFTLGISLAAILFADLLFYRDSWKNRIQRYLTLGAGFGAIVSLFLLYLTLFNAWEGYREMQQFLSYYTGLQFQSLSSFAIQVLQRVPTNLSDEYTLTVLFGTIGGIALAASGLRGTQKYSDDISENPNSPLGTIVASSEHVDPATQLLRFQSLLLLLLLGTIILEGKWMFYHLSRMFSSGAILTGGTILFVLNVLWKRRRDRFVLVILGLVALLFLAFSPFTRYVFHSRGVLLLATSGAEAFDAYYEHSRETDDDWTMKDLKDVGEYLRTHRKEGDRILVSSGVAGMVYLKAQYVPDISVFHSGFIIATFAPESWRETTREYILRQRPAMIVVHKSDRMINITGTQETSVDVFNRWPDVMSLLEQSYQVAYEDPAFRLYERKDHRTGADNAEGVSADGGDTEDRNTQGSPAEIGTEITSGRDAIDRGSKPARRRADSGDIVRE